MEGFGDKELNIEHEWPSRQQLQQQLVHDQLNIKLCGINYKKAADDYPLSGFQLEFTGGVQSELFETNYARKNNKLNSVQIDVTRRIRKISMFVCTANNYLKRLRLIDDNNENLADLTWWTNDQGEWITQEIPYDSEIIGFYCNTSTSNFICRLGFILWKGSGALSPQPTAFQMVKSELELPQDNININDESFSDMGDLKTD